MFVRDKKGNVIMHMAFDPADEPLSVPRPPVRDAIVGEGMFLGKVTFDLEQIRHDFLMALDYIAEGAD